MANETGSDPNTAAEPARCRFGGEMMTCGADMANETGSDPNTAAEPARCRPFGLVDAMILVAGAALSLSEGVHLVPLLARAVGGLCIEAGAKRSHLPENWPAFWKCIQPHLKNTLWYGFQVSEMLLVGMTIAFFFVRLRPPRPSLRALLRYSGTVAGVAIVFGAFWVTGWLYYVFPNKVDATNAAAFAVGGTVAMAWSVLALGRRWQPDPGWVDQMGRILGCAAIATASLGLIMLRI
jgi:hypothetical protein